MAPPQVQFANPATIAPPTGYSHVADVRGGRLVFVAGQVALDPSGALVGPGDYRAQAEQVFRNLAAALTHVGGSFRNVVKMTIFVRDMAQLPEVREVRDRYVDRERPPTSTAVGVAALARPEFLLEVEAVAALE